MWSRVARRLILPLGTALGLAAGCDVGPLVDHWLGGRVADVSDDRTAATTARRVTYRLLVDEATGIDSAAAQFDVAYILNHERGWRSVTDVEFVVADRSEPDVEFVVADRSEPDVEFVVADRSEPDVEIRIATPDAVDAGCAPLRTGGRLSCRNGGTIWLNADRWTGAVEHWTASIAEYRAYLVNHEMGHFLGHGHRRCPARGEPAPVMQQQTKALDGCVANGWLVPARPVGAAL